MAAVEDVYNEALSLMGGRPTVGSVAESSVEAKELNRHYPYLRDSLLEGTLWNFARRSARGTVLKGAYGVTGATAVTTTWDSTWPDPPWLYAYAYPTDALRIRYLVDYAALSGGVVPQASHDAYYALNPPYEFASGSDPSAGRIILANVHRPVIFYTIRVTDPLSWSYQFRQALVYLLAARISLALAGNDNVMRLNEQRGLTALQQAMVTEANTGLNLGQSLPDWIRARGLPDAGQMP